MTALGEVALRPTTCAICGPGAEAAELYPARLDPETFVPAVFSARRSPDGRHYRIVRCRHCGLVRSDPVAAPEVVDALYRASGFSYGNETDSLTLTYRRALDRVLSAGASRGALLEIGCGNGFFLQEARAAGFADVRGVEPSRDAVERAAPGIRDALVCDTMRRGLFPSSRFDVVCIFQVFDHLADPRACLTACADVLKPGGFLLAINHNVEAVSAMMLGRRSPIFDVEHTFLYSPATMSRLVAAEGFDVVSAGGMLNTCSVSHLLWLTPLPAVVKQALRDGLQRLGAGGVRVRVPLGNLQLIARKRAL